MPSEEHRTGEFRGRGSLAEAIHALAQATCELAHNVGARVEAQGRRLDGQEARMDAIQAVQATTSDNVCQLKSDVKSVIETMIRVEQTTKDTNEASKRPVRLMLAERVMTTALTTLVSIIVTIIMGLLVLGLKVSIRGNADPSPAPLQSQRVK